VIKYLDIFFEDYLISLNVSSDLFSNILEAAKIDYWHFLTNEFRPRKNKNKLKFLSKDCNYIVFKVKDVRESLANYQNQYNFIGVNSFKELNILVEKYKKLKAFL
jgi:hypothetical protein